MILMDKEWVYASEEVKWIHRLSEKSAVFSPKVDVVPEASWVLFYNQGVSMSCVNTGVVALERGFLWDQYAVQSQSS